MVVRHNRSTGDSFLGCGRFPACRGTRPIPGALTESIHRQEPRYRLSAGGRPRGLADQVELRVARALGRNLTRPQGFLVQILTLAASFLVIWAFVASGLLFGISEAVGHWYASQIHLGPSASPFSTPMH